MEATRQGGMRLSGRSPRKVKGLPVVSVITIVYNGSALLGKTIASVLRQDWPNIEYILIDGGSTDGTVDIIRSHESRLAYWISERDRGIYDAMNKGLAAATGDYVWFMNCGDLIYSDTTLSKIFAPFHLNEDVSVNMPLPDILYGDAMIVDPDYNEIGLRRLRPPERLTWKSFRKGMVVCHQAILVKREITEPFDTARYSHSADYDWVLKALIKADGRRKTQDIRQKTEDIRRRTEDGGRKAEDGGRKTEDGGRKTEDGTYEDWGRNNVKPPHAAGGDEASQPEKSPATPMASPRLQPGDSGDSGNPMNPGDPFNTHMVLCAFLDGGHSKKNIGVSLRERFDSMRRHYGLVQALLIHLPIVVRFVWYVLLNRRF